MGFPEGINWERVNGSQFRLCHHDSAEWWSDKAHAVPSSSILHHQDAIQKFAAVVVQPGAHISSRYLSMSRKNKFQPAILFDRSFLFSYGLLRQWMHPSRFIPPWVMASMDRLRLHNGRCPPNWLNPLYPLAKSTVCFFNLTFRLQSHNTKFYTR